MTDIAEPESLYASLDSLQNDAEVYFDKAGIALENIPRPDRWSTDSGPNHRDHFWAALPPERREKAEMLAERLLALTGQIANAIRNAPLASEADQRDVMTGTKAMRASLFFRSFRSWTTEILHDEGTFLGVQPGGQSDDAPSAPRQPSAFFSIGRIKSAAFSTWWLLRVVLGRQGRRTPLQRQLDTVRVQPSL